MGCCCAKTQPPDPGGRYIRSSNEDDHLNNWQEDDEIYISSSLLTLTNKYVLDTLAVIRTLVDNEQEPPISMSKLHTIADQESGWLIVVRSMVHVIPLDDPLGPAVIALLLDDCPLPCKETVVNLCKLFELSGEKAKEAWKEPCIHRNICVILGCIAEKMAGPSSIALLTPSTLEYLLSHLDENNHPCVILFAIIALEKFAQTSENKVTILSDLGEGKENKMKLLEHLIHCDDLQKKQVGFCAQWCLDNLFICENRSYSYKNIDTSNLNAMLNNSDVTEYLKISPDGLQARCDASSFESVRCTFQVDGGIWYYEASLITAGVMQIGWATKDSKFLNHEGFGIGDDEYSVAYDGCRQLIWHNAESAKHPQPCWKAGDVLGLLLDIDESKVVFYLNGVPLQPKVNIFNHATTGFFAAASFMSFQQCEFNFGWKPFAFPPEGVSFRSFNEVASLDPAQKIVLPRHIRLQMLRATSVEEGSCTLCFDQKAIIQLHPCRHKGFCKTCSLILETCPMCRQYIEERREEEEEEEEGKEAGEVSGSSSSKEELAGNCFGKERVS